jgi:hypothetical protein
MEVFSRADARSLGGLVKPGHDNMGWVAFA